MSQPTPFTIRDLLRIRDFRWLWLGQIVSNFGDALTHLTLVLLINRFTAGSTTAIATLLIALALPQATIGLFAGVFVDRFDRKRTMLISNLIRGVLVLGFIFVGVNHPERLWLIYVIAFFHSTIGAFFTPARSALIPNIVPHAGLLAANSLSQMSLVLFRVIGTAVAGLLVGLLNNFWLAFVIDAATFLISFGFILLIQVPQRQKTAAAASARQLLGEFSSGMQLIFRSRLLSGTILGIGIAMLGLGALNVLLAPLIVNDLQVPETWFGAVEFAQTAGMLLSGSLVAALAARFKPTSLVSGGLLFLGLFTLPLAAVRSVWHLFPLLFGIGLVVTPLNAGVATIVQTSVEDAARGRVSASLGAMIQTSSLVSMFFAGSVAAWLGVRGLFLLCGSIVIAAAAVAVWMFRCYQPPLPEPAPIGIQAEPNPGR